MPLILTLRPTPSPSDPIVVLVTAFIVFLVLAFVIATAPNGRERTLRLLFVYLTYGVLELIVKRLAHFAWFLYPIKFGLFFCVLISWWQWREGQRPKLASIPLGGVLAAYLAVAAIQMFNPHQANPIVGMLGWLSDFAFASFYFVAFDLFDGIAPMRRFLRVTALLGVVSALACFTEQWLDPTELMRKYPMFVHLVYFTAAGEVVYRPSALSPYSEIFAIVAMLGLLASRQRPVVLLTAGIAVCVVANVLHAVRIVWMTGIAAVVLLNVLSRGRRLVSIALVAASVALAVDVGIAVSKGGVAESLISATTPLATFQRTRLWGLMALPAIMAQFPFGVGVGEASPGVRFVDSSDITRFGFHNYISELAAQMSIIGPVLLLIFCARVVVTAWGPVWRAKPDEWRAQVSTSLTLVGAMAASFFGGGGLGAYPVSDYFWLMAGATMSLIHEGRFRSVVTARLMFRRNVLPRHGPVLLSGKPAASQRWLV